MKGVARSTTAPTGAARWWLTAHAGLVYLFFYAPIAVLVLYSFNDSRIIGGWDGFTFRWYGEFAENRSVRDALAVSFKVALLSTAISVVLGTLSALSIERFRWRGRRLFDAVLYLPIIIPDVTMAVMLLVGAGLAPPVPVQREDGVIEVRRGDVRVLAPPFRRRRGGARGDAGRARRPKRS